MNRTTGIGDDCDNAWNDAHLSHCWRWLYENPQSPYAGSKLMVLDGLKITTKHKQDIKRWLDGKSPYKYSFSTRLRMTTSFKRVLAGYYEPVVTQRKPDGTPKKWEMRDAVNPKPLNCSSFYRGTISLHKKGFSLGFVRTDAFLDPKHDPKGKNRLLNAFSNRNGVS